MRVEIISVGDELLIGQTINTNASWIGDRLLNIGLMVEWVTTVGDSAKDIHIALRTAVTRADVVLVTGGLGPTHDDITKKVVADYFGAPLIMNDDVLEQVKERFRRRGLPMARVNEGQALVPAGAEVIKNENGTAPGLIFRRSGQLFFIMPGVPHEMKAMMTNAVLSELKRQLRGKAIRVKKLMTTGVPESTLAERLDNIAEIEKYVRIAFLPDLFGVKLRLMAKADDEATAVENLARAEKMVREKIARDIYAENDISLEEAVAALLVERGETLAVAESCTGGMMADRLTNIPGSSQFFTGGIVAYSNKVKIDVLRVPAALIDEHGAVSSEVARAMAKGVRIVAQVDYGLAVTGIAGPTGGSVEKPVGLVFVGYADKERSIVEKCTFANDRIGNKKRSTQAALNLLRKMIIKSGI